MRGVRRIVGRWYMLQVARLHRIPSPACVGSIVEHYTRSN